MSATTKPGKRQLHAGKPQQCEKKKPKEEDPMQDGNDDEIPTRNLEKLYCSSVTIHCALQNHCVPCGYKVCCFDVALDTGFSKKVPNQRPEQCSRSSNKGGNPLDGATLGYQRGMKVLTCGDGDFSFSLAVARLLSADSKTKKKKPIHLVATSYESKETLCRVYPHFEATAAELESLGAILCYQVDATRLKGTLPSTVTTTKENQTALLFHRIIWNFPCTAIQEGQDGQNDAMEKNQQLVRTFVENARHLVASGGEIQMCHKTKPPYNQWRIEQVALELCQQNDDEPSVVYKGRIVLDKCLLPPYQPRKALHSKSFPCHDACFYVFRVVSSGTGDETNKTAIETIPESLPEYNLTDETKDQGLAPVTRELVLKIRESLLKQPANKRNKRGNGERQQKRRRR